jgi:hypothetical protein
MMTQRDIALLREFLERFKRICPDADGKADPAALMNAGRASESAPRLQSKSEGVRRFGGSPFVLGHSTIYVVQPSRVLCRRVGNRAKSGSPFSIMKSFCCKTVRAACWQYVLAAFRGCWLRGLEVAGRCTKLVVRL